MKLLFRLKYTIRDLRLPAGVVHTFDYGGAHHLSVELRQPSPQEQELGHKLENAFSTASLQIDVSDKNEQVFAAITANAVLRSDVAEEQVRIEYQGPDGKQIRLPGLLRFPDHFRSFIDGVRRELSDYSRRTVSALRWRLDYPGPHNPYNSRGLDWSNDGAFWHPAPGEWSTRVEVRQQAGITPTVFEDVHRMVAEGGGEPFDHEMLREAWGERHSNPRSSLVIGMAAAELGVKRCIATLVPGADWLAANLPTPPLVQILLEYLPRLPTRLQLGGETKPPPPDVLAVLKKGVTMRNQLAHAGKARPTGDEVEMILEAVSDLLWLLDYYMGVEWAAEYVRRDTRLSLGLLA